MYPNDADPKILYRDAHLVAVDKAAGLLVHRSPIAAGEQEALLQRLRDALGLRVYPAHRLDRPTSGLMLFGLSPQAGARLSHLFETRQVDKRYLAVVRGWLGPEGVIDYPLQDAPELPLRPAVTLWRSLARVELPIPVGHYPVARYSLVEARPLTGRLHQIRRHFHHVFHPIVGDTTHGEGRHNRLFRDHCGCRRLLLHAHCLSMPHPWGSAALELRAPPDGAWQTLMERLGWGGVVAGGPWEGPGGT